MNLIKNLNYLLWIGWVLSLACTIQAYISYRNNIIFIDTDKNWKYEYSEIGFWGFFSMFLISNISIIFYYLKGKKLLS